MISLTNIEDGEEVYQRCLLISGRCDDALPEDFIEVDTKNEAGDPSFPEQRWPVCQGWFKVLVMLSPGANAISLRCGHSAAHTTEVMCPSE